ncbi:Tfp pilus assembly protein, ATPase PilM [Desulfosporosinus acidiphilus SJ4]|uniref:Tfp pilus assembly protein, ATPase PilM n=1 Tax=Desulfosporosinus acidiphilus (strain DSM 22704 / JCM 16185 / SJ4) TaxID=646529 RepID=I4D948_DESAJ|nr:pilus assembly protein PilM [Desulfosporosinus acidiphilus]AFM42322.1 Tfp pilus assembly protein, ATPase PilM [Desulfosporosinus acidiphilus SJ4]
MLIRKQWLAVVRGDRWIVAKVARRKLKLDILHIAEYHAPIEYKTLGDEGESLEKNLSIEEKDPEVKLPLGGTKTDLLKTWLHNNHVPINKLRIAISCPGVITRMITLPLLANHDLDKLLTDQVEQYFTLNISDYVVDYRLLERFSEEGELRQRVLLAAIPKYHWERLWSEWREIGIQPKVVDLAADSLARLYSKLTSKDLLKANVETETSLDLAIVDMNSERVEFILLEHGVFFLYSDIEVSLDGLDQVKNALSSLSVGHENGHPEETDDDLQTAKLQAWAKKEIETALQNVLQSLANFFSFFAARHFGKTLDFIYLTGEYSDLPYLEEIFQSNLDISTQVGFPNAWRPRFNRRTKTFQKYGMKYGSLYGIAMREG